MATKRQAFNFELPNPKVRKLFGGDVSLARQMMEATECDSPMELDTEKSVLYHKAPLFGGFPPPLMGQDNSINDRISRLEEKMNQMDRKIDDILNCMRELVYHFQTIEKMVPPRTDNRASYIG